MAIYVSKEKTMVNMNQYIKDRKVAEKITGDEKEAESILREIKKRIG